MSKKIMYVILRKILPTKYASLNTSSMGAWVLIVFIEYILKNKSKNKQFFENAYFTVCPA